MIEKKQRGQEKVEDKKKMEFRTTQEKAEDETVQGRAQDDICYMS